MDYAPFFAQTPQPFFGMTMASTPSYSGETDKIGPADAMDTSFFGPNSFDNFRFSSSLVPTTADMTSTATPIGVVGSVDSGLGQDGMEFLHTDGMDGSGAGFGGERRSSSEEKDGMTPAQSRRKAQNRAAQRAFRERKEKHVKDLETKLTVLESSASALASDNQRLKLALQRATTENEILRASSRPNSMYGTTHPLSPTRNADSESTDPLYSTPSSGYSADTDGALLPASATWDLIQSHSLVRQGFVDIADVCERLRGAARCDGSGPVFAEREVRRAIEESRRAGGDELI